MADSGSEHALSTADDISEDDGAALMVIGLNNAAALPLFAPSSPSSLSSSSSSSSSFSSSDLFQDDARCYALLRTEDGHQRCPNEALIAPDSEGLVSFTLATTSNLCRVHRDEAVITSPLGFFVEPLLHDKGLITEIAREFKKQMYARDACLREIASAQVQQDYVTADRLKAVLHNIKAEINESLLPVVALHNPTRTELRCMYADVIGLPHSPRFILETADHQVLCELCALSFDIMETPPVRECQCACGCRAHTRRFVGSTQWGVCTFCYAQTHVSSTMVRTDPTVLAELLVDPLDSRPLTEIEWRQYKETLDSLSLATIQEAMQHTAARQLRKNEGRASRVRAAPVPAPPPLHKRQREESSDDDDDAQIKFIGKGPPASKHAKGLAQVTPNPQTRLPATLPSRLRGVSAALAADDESDIARG
jgi:hypothetical protein